MKQDGCSKQIFDDLASHIALFHTSSRPSSSNPNPRKTILRWFSSLSPPQRQASLTVVDSDFVKILLQMIVRLQTEGLCHFFVLPDLPSAPGSKLPSLCHRQLDGLLSRASASNATERLVFRSVRLFGSRDGECGTEYDLDSMSVSEEFVKDAELFVKAMDEISSGEFLRELDPNISQSAWVELQWLKAKGYYSLESFISNRLELALRKSWLEYNGGKKPRSGKSSSKVAAAGIAAGAFWRQKGCLDWWLGLDPGVRKKVYVGFLCKGAKSLVKEIIERRFSDLKDELAPIWIQSKPVSSCTYVSPFQRMSQLCCSLDPNFFFGFDSASSSRKPCLLANQLNPLLILREISEKLLRLSNSKCEIESMFFSELGSVTDVSDWTLRRLRWSLMSMWKECMKIELTGDSMSKKSQTQTEEGSCKAKKKNHNLRRMNSSTKTSKGNGNPTKDKENSKSKMSCRGNLASPDSSASVHEEIIKKESLKPQTEMENTVANQKVNPMKPNGGRRRSRSKTSTCTKDPKSKAVEVDAPLENEILKQPASAGIVLSEIVSSKEEVGRVSGREVVGSDIPGWKRKHFWSEDEIDLKNLKNFPDSAPPIVSIHSQCHSPAAGILHLDSNDSENFLYPININHQGFDASNKTGGHQIIPSRVLPMSFDWPLMVRSLGRLNFDTLYNTRLQPTLCSGVKTNNEGDTMYSRDGLDFCEFKSTLEAPDDSEGYWVSEDDSDSHTFSGRDYNKLFGGGVMYWNTSDHVSTGFPQAPSPSSEDSSCAWHEADLNRAIDDMVGYVLPGNEAPEEKAACSEGLKGDSHSYPVLRPIIIPNISRKGSRSEFKINLEHTSPNVTSTRRNFPRIKRPLSPVVLCVPRDSRSALPCVGDSRKHRGFPVVRSGSSSPRSWGMRSCHHEENASPGTHMCLNGGEIIWASWENGKHAGSPFMQPVPGTLLQDRLIAISHRDLEHPDIGLPVQAVEPSCPSHKECLSTMHNLLHEEIDSFCKKVAAENLSRKPYINWAVKRVAKSLQVLWPRSRTSVFGSNATGLALPSSDVDLVVCLPPVRNLEPIKEAGILEGRNGIKETCLQHAARYLANQDWVKNDSLKTIENTAIPLIMLIAEVPHDSIDVPQRRDPSDPKESSFPNLVQSLPGKNTLAQSVRLDISFRSSTHTGLQTMELVRQLTEQFPASIPLALVLKQFLADRNLDRSYSGGLSSYCLVLLIIRFLQHERHLGRSNSQNLGSLLMDFLYFFGNVFDPRQMHVSIQGSGTYMKRERGHSIDPIHIDDPLCPTNNVGKNCFRIHQCIKAFADAYSTIDRQLSSLSTGTDFKSHVPFRLLRKIIPGIEGEYG